MLVPAVLDFIHIFDAVGSFIFVDRGVDRKPTFHIQTCNTILSAESHYPTNPEASVLYAGSLLREKPDMLRGKTSNSHPLFFLINHRTEMVTTIANDVSATVIYVEDDALAHYLVEEAVKLPHAPFLSGSGMLMDHMMQPSARP
ncbi:hypothetical protein BD769DRAFT_1776598 [Suillus cothurnatus]|nr:hypothetical protein BD769DRAFT_1776598 [Suillus cothurnatus]